MHGRMHAYLFVSSYAYVRMHVCPIMYVSVPTHERGYCVLWNNYWKAILATVTQSSGKLSVH